MRGNHVTRLLISGPVVIIITILSMSGASTVLRIAVPVAILILFVIALPAAVRRDRNAR